MFEYKAVLYEEEAELTRDQARYRAAGLRISPEKRYYIFYAGEKRYVRDTTECH